MTQTTEETKMTETQEEEQEGALESLMKKVSMADPLEVPLDNGQIFSITQEQFISYYLPANATREEKAKCFNETRVAGLNPAIKGDCHYFKTGDGPLSLFVGYHVYVRKAYKNGLHHIHKPELIYDEETGKLDSCIITLEIDNRPDFVWETWYEEVVGETRGVPNKRWVKAGRQMLIKCSITNALRLSGIATLGILPPSLEEMPDFPSPGMRTLTQDQIDRWKDAPEKMVEKQEFEETMLGEVNAETHQIDMSAFRHRYFNALKELGMSFTTDEARRHFQKQDLGIKGNGSISNLSVEEWADVFEKLAVMKAELKQAAAGNDDPVHDDTQAEGEQEDPQKQGVEFDQGGRKSLKDEFLSEAALVFPDIIERQEWYSANITEDLGEIPTEKMLEHGLVLLNEVKEGRTIEKAAQASTDDSSPSKTQEAEEEGQDDAKESTRESDSDNTDTACERLADELRVDAKELSSWASVNYKTPEKALGAFVAALNDELILNDISTKFGIWKEKQGDSDEVRTDLAGKPIEE